MKKRQKKDRLQLEIEKAQNIDEDEEEVDKLQLEIDLRVKLLKESKDHKILDTNLN